MPARKTMNQMRIEAFIEAVENDNLTPYINYCNIFHIPYSDNDRIRLVTCYKAAIYCEDIPEEIKEKARKKCIAMGFKPTKEGWW